MQDELFTPCEKDANGNSVSAASLGMWGDETVLEPAWERLETAATAEQFYRAAAELVFHARHMCPSLHARLAEMLKMPFKKAAHRPAEWQRHEEIVFGLTMMGGSLASEWKGFSRLQIIADIEGRYGLTHDAARKAYDAAKRTIRERRASQEAAEGKKDGG